MPVGPHVFGPNRVGLWVQNNTNLRDKLTHFLPRLRGPIPNLTDIFLPPEATIDHRRQVLAADFFQHMYMGPPHGKGAKEYVDAALARHKAQNAGAIEYNLEGLPDSTLADFIKVVVQRTRAKKPNLPIRINVVPWKGVFLTPLRQLVAEDEELFLIVQAYGGNMDVLYAAEEVKHDLTSRGFHGSKVSVMHAVMCRAGGSQNRQITLPAIRDRGSLYIDDLLLDAGFLN